MTSAVEDPQHDQPDSRSQATSTGAGEAPDEHSEASERGDSPEGNDPQPPTHSELPPTPPGWDPYAFAHQLEQVQVQGDLQERKGHLWFPHLLVRAAAGDTGERPVWPPTPCWTSPDIHVFPYGVGVDLAQAVIQPRVGETYQLGVHVWNLGKFAAYGVLVRAWWVLPGFSPNATDPLFQPHLIGSTLIDLGDRYSEDAHQIVLLPEPWEVEDAADGHQCLFACAESFADPHGGDTFAANSDRHVGQRNISVIGAADDALGFLQLIDRVPPEVARIEIGVGEYSTPDLTFAYGRGLASSPDVPFGIGPITFGERRPLGALMKLDQGWAAELADGTQVGDGQEVEFAEAVLQLLAIEGTTGADVLASPVLADLSYGAVHLSTERTGFTWIIASD